MEVTWLVPSQVSTRHILWSFLHHQPQIDTRKGCPGPASRTRQMRTGWTPQGIMALGVLEIGPEWSFGSMSSAAAGRGLGGRRVGWREVPKGPAAVPGRFAVAGIGPWPTGRVRGRRVRIAASGGVCRGGPASAGWSGLRELRWGLIGGSGLRPLAVDSVVQFWIGFVVVDISRSDVPDLGQLTEWTLMR